MTPDRPTMRGTAQNPDVYFQGRETVNKYYNDYPAIVQKYMDKVAEFTGRHYHLVDYVGAPDADRVIVVMGSAASTIKDTVAYLSKKGEKVGVLIVRLYRPFPSEQLVAALPKTAKRIAVLDRSKEPGSAGEPLLEDVLTAISGAAMKGEISLPRVIGGRYGLSSKEFTPAMVKAIYDELAKDSPKDRFTVGIDDDVTHLSLAIDPNFKLESDFFQAMFFGLGSDGTVGANKNSIKIIGNETDNYAQGYFVYDSKKSGSMTTSHLRFGKSIIDAPYLIEENQADFVACHHTPHLESVDMLKYAKEGATFLVNTPHSAETVWDTFPSCPGGNHPEAPEGLCDRRLRRCRQDGHGTPHQYRDADMLLLEARKRSRCGNRDRNTSRSMRKRLTRKRAWKSSRKTGTLSTLRLPTCTKSRFRPLSLPRRNSARRFTATLRRL